MSCSVLCLAQILFSPRCLLMFSKFLPQLSLFCGCLSYCLSLIFRNFLFYFPLNTRSASALLYIWLCFPLGTQRHPTIPSSFSLFHLPPPLLTVIGCLLLLSLLPYSLPCCRVCQCSSCSSRERRRRRLKCKP